METQFVDLLDAPFSRRGSYFCFANDNFKAENVRGIYIPYWIVDCDHKASVIIRGTVKRGKYTTTVHCGRSGRMKLRDLPLDASKMLSDESSSRLEPFNLHNMTPFDEDYLLGFYSNISDVTYGDLRGAANLRADTYFDEAAIKDIKGVNGKKIESEKHLTKIDYSNLRYAMLPCWFITYFHKGQHNTILVNGQTGKIVCGVPWNKVLFYTLLIVAGIALTVVSFIVLKPVLAALFSSSGSRSSSSNDSSGKIFGAIVCGVIALFSLGIRKIVKVIKSINLTQSKAIFNFVKKRQE